MEWLFKKAEEFLRRHKFIRRWRKVLAVMMAMVVFMSTYAMVLPAITLETGEGAEIGLFADSSGDESVPDGSTVTDSIPEAGAEGAALTTETAVIEDTAPAETAPVENVSTENAPAENTPAEPEAAETAPAETAPTEAVPTEAAPTATETPAPQVEEVSATPEEPKYLDNEKLVFENNSIKLTLTVPAAAKVVKGASLDVREIGQPFANDGLDENGRKNEYLSYLAAAETALNLTAEEITYIEKNIVNTPAAELPWARFFAISIKNADGAIAPACALPVEIIYKNTAETAADGLKVMCLLPNGTMTMIGSETKVATAAQTPIALLSAADSNFDITSKFVDAGTLTFGTFAVQVSEVDAAIEKEKEEAAKAAAETAKAESQPAAESATESVPAEDASVTEAVESEESLPEDASKAEPVEESLEESVPAEDASVSESAEPEESLPEDASEAESAEESAPAETESAAEEAEKTEEKAEIQEQPKADDKVTKTLVTKGADYTVTMTYTADAKIPAGARLSAKEILPTAYNYKGYFNKAADALNLSDEQKSNTYARFFDIKILLGNSEVTPAAPVQVEITYNKPQEKSANAEMNAVHFSKEGPEVIAAETTQADAATGDVNAVGFEAGSFSVYGVMYTVDFETADGGTYSIPGTSSIALSDLLYAIGLDISIEDVVNVEFSDPSLISVARIAVDTTVTTNAGSDGEDPSEVGVGEYVVSAGDWLLTSLKAFNSNEVLTITTSDGTKHLVNVTDAQFTSNLADVMTDAYLTIDGTKVADGASITIEEGQSFDMHLEFSENDFLQFPEDATVMTYALPAGITLGTEAFSKKVDVSLGIDGTLKNNTLTYNPATNSLEFTWNRRDPKFRRLLAADNAKLSFDLTGWFTSDATHVDFGNGYDITVTQTEHKEADVTKDGKLYMPGENGNPFGNEVAIKYTVTVTSEGATTVNVNDTVEGSNVTLVTTKGGNGGWTAESNKGTTITPSFTSKGFSLNGQNLQDGEKVTITYWGKVSTSDITNLQNVSYSQTGNKVTVTGDDIPDKEATHYEHTIGVNKVTKNAVSVGDVDEDGKQVVSWKIVVNDPPVESIGGTTLTDHIASESLSLMDYNTTGIHVVAKRANGQTVFDKDVGWNDPEITLTNESYDKRWVYTIPATNEPLVYEITYDTIVDTTKYNNGAGGYFSVVNESEGKPGKGTGTATVGQPIGEVERNIVYSKTAIDINEETITWSVPVNVKSQSGGYNSFVIEDTIPSVTYYQWGYADTLKEIRVEGLQGTEWYDISYKYLNTNDSFKNTENDTKPSHVVLTFYKDGAVDGDVTNKNGNNSKANPGLNADSDRILNLTIITENNEEWMQQGAEHYTEPSATTHTNTIKINELTPESASAKPMKKTVMKLRDGQHSVSGPGGATAFEEVETPGTDANPHGIVISNKQIDYPAYKFWVLVGGITNSNLENGNQIIITDTFNEHLRLMLPEGVESDKAPILCGTEGTGSMGSQLQLDASKGESFTWKQSDGNAEFTITNPPKNGDNYYPYYLVQYWLVPKSLEDLEAIKREAMNNNGVAILENIATSDDISDELDFSYNYSVIDKSSVVENHDGVSLLKYTIDINKDMLPLNNGLTMEMTDSYSRNLSVDFGTIEVTATQKAPGGGTTETYYDEKTGTYKPIKDLITWDFRNNVGTYQIPDATHVTITYYARPVGDPGSIQTVTNTAYMEGYYDTETKDQMVNMSGEGSAEVIRIRLLKFGADHMEEGLNGAVFRLLDQDKNPLKTFVTEETGYLNKAGVLHAGHDAIDYTEDANSNYVASAAYGDLTPEAKARVDEGTLKLTITPDDFGELTWDEYCYQNEGSVVTYADLTEEGLKKLGITKHAGFAEIMLDQHVDGMTLKREHAYYLQEIVAPPGYEIDTTLYSFLITEQSDYSAPAGVYVYHNNDVLTVRDWPEETPTLKLQKTFTGNAELTEEQKNAVTFTLQRKVDSVWTDYTVPVWREESKQDVSSFTYGDFGVKEDTSTEPSTYEKGEALFKNGVFEIENLPAGEYRVIESNMNMTKPGGGNYERKTEYLVDGSIVRVNGDLISYNDNTGEKVATPDDETNGVTFTVDGEHSNLVSITNTYYINEYTLTKTAADTGELLANAKFAIYSTDGTTDSLVKDNILTDASGKIEITKTDNTWDTSVTFADDTLYYIVETQAPDGFITPDKPEKCYFYFSEENSSFDPKPLLPSGETAVNLRTGFGTARISNKRDSQKTYFKVKKAWVNALGQDITESMTDDEAVSVTLMRTTARPTAGKAVTTVDLDSVETDLSHLHTLTLTNSTSGESARVYFIPGDKLQLSIYGEDLTGVGNNPTTSPYTTLTMAANVKTMKSWTAIGPDSDVTVTISGESITGIAVSNAAAGSRSYILTEAEAESLGGEAVPNTSEVTLDLTNNNWEYTFSNLPVADENGHPYFYYITEAESLAKETSINISGKTITVTNTAPDQLEVNKKWEDSEGNSINEEKTDGSITYELYQVENPLPVRPYTGNGTIGVDFSNFKRWEYYHEVAMPDPTGHVNGRILEGSTVQIQISTTDAHNSPLTNYPEGSELVIGGGQLVSDVNSATAHTRTIILADVDSTITISGAINASGAIPSISVTVLEEPTNASTEWNDLVKNKMGDVTVTYNNATFAKSDAFASSNVRVSKGAKPWSSLVNNLPKTGVPTSGPNAGMEINYSYYVVEVPSPVDSSHEEATYQLDGENVTIANGEPGDTIVIINKEKEIPLTEFTFYKKWNDLGSRTVEWGDVASITVTIGRKAENVVDADFSYTYEVAKIAFTEEGTEVAEKNGKEDAPVMKAILVPAVAPETVPQYKFFMENLPKLNDSGVQYVYYAVEEKVSGYKDPLYGDSNGTVIVNAANASDGGCIVNKPDDSVELPSTGGPGTLIYSMLGMMLIAFAGTAYMILLRRRRASLKGGGNPR